SLLRSPAAARRAGRRRAAPALAATAVLAVATASGYGLSSVVPRSGAETPAQQSTQPAEAGGPAPHVLPEVPSPLDPNGETPVLTAATPEVDPAVSPGATLGTDPLAVPGAPVGAGPVVGPAPPPQAAPGGGVVAAPQAPPAPGATRSTAARPPAAAPTSKASPAAGGGTVRPTTRPPADTATQKPASPKPSVMPGQVNSSGRNLALNGTASASSVEVNAVWDARYAIDGDSDSRWSSSFQSDPQWLSVDLGAVWQVTEVRLMWERAYATAYRVEVSTDGRNWTVVYRTTAGSGGTVTIAVPRTPARYVRMVGTARVMQGYGYSLHEFEIR
ncbi:discoidin domain-containing protein, partial [Micromonospora sp. NPDC000207]|uniref:discoidin domain-containing protein n=1 Tax=Micromonospora sp. NPDC000207 TaxID=3154246 RepID=UPI003332F212